MDTQFTSSDNTSLIADVISAINGLPAAFPTNLNHKVRTTAIKKSFVALGKEKGYTVRAGGFRNDYCEPQWLYDVVWYRNDPSGHLREIRLVLESELDFKPAYVEFDFAKLLIAKSPIKVMLFQDLKGNAPELFSLLETGICSFEAERANETYVLGCYENLKDAYIIKTITA